jgi:cytochrome c oxidase subunit 2
MYSTTGIDASNFVSSFNTAFYFIVGISLIFLVGITFLMLFFVRKYNRKRNKKATQITGSNLLEIVWTVIPTLLALGMFYYGWAGWRPMSKPPKDALNVTSTARMWSFSFSYDNNRQSPDLIIPVDTAVKINLVSLDVIHSLYIPAFRIKSDMVPGREKVMWFKAETEGVYDLLCAEYCGLRHSYMNSKVRVLSREDFNEWYNDTSAVIQVAEKEAPEAEGLSILETHGCNACHSTDGSVIVGPSYLHLYGSQQTVIRDGKEITVTADDEYIRKSIRDPDADVVKGFQKGVMQPYQDELSDDDITKIIEYLKSLNED